MTQTDDSIALQADLCARSPRTPGPWVVLARQLLEAGRAAEAAAAVEMALALAPRHSAARSIRKAAVEALEAADPALSALELMAAMRPTDAGVQLELGETYFQLERPADAERSLKRALAQAPHMAAAHACLGAVYLSVGIEDGAEHHSKLALAAEPGHGVASQTLATVLQRRGDPEAAERLLDAAYERQSLYVETANPSRASVLVLATRTGGNIPNRYILPPTHYTRLIWYMEHAREEQFAALPPYDLVFNTIGDPDQAPGADEPVRRFLAQCRKPVLNDPAKVARTRRHLASELFGDLEGVVVPASARLDAALIQRIGLAAAVSQAGIDGPVLIRPVGSHGGRGLERADTPEALAGLEAAFHGTDVYATAYWDGRWPDGRFRKGRMIFVDRRPYPYHWAVSDGWMVHYDTSGMDDDPLRQAEELRFLTEPEAVIGAQALAAIAKIGQRMDLDYCGVDFSVLSDGRVLLFEANATMLAHPEAPDGPLAYKNPAVQRITDAFQARLASF